MISLIDIAYLSHHKLLSSLLSSNKLLTLTANLTDVNRRLISGLPHEDLHRGTSVLFVYYFGKRISNKEYDNWLVLYTVVSSSRCL